MKNITLCTIIALCLTAFFIGGCKKDIATKKRTLSLTDTTATVSTVTQGPYNFVAAGTGGNIYLLRWYSDTVYKVSSAGTKTVFYVAPASTPADTAINMLNYLTTDSAGNVYTANFTSQTAKVLKIDASGSATTYIDNLESSLGTHSSYNIKIDNTGNIYFTGVAGIYKAAPGGTVTQISTFQTNYFALDRSGNIYVVNNNTIGKINSSGTFVIVAGTGAPGSTDGPGASATFGLISAIACDNKGNIFVGESAEDGSVNDIRVINTADVVSTLLSNAPGHVDGSVSIAKIAQANCITADATGNLFITEAQAGINDVRKITF